MPASESKLFGKNNPDAYKDKVDAGKSINAQGKDQQNFSDSKQRWEK